MKKLFICFIICALLSIMLSSCSDSKDGGKNANVAPMTVSYGDIIGSEVSE